MKENNSEGYISRRHALKKSALAIAGMSTLPLMSFAQSTENEKVINTEEFKGKTAFITGGARGIGLATAEMFAANGANVVIYDIASNSIEGVGHSVASIEDLEKANSRILEYGVKCIAIKGDVRSRESLNNSVKQTVSEFGTIDFAVANAGVTQIGHLSDFSDNEIAAILDINVAGIIKTTQAVIPQMRRQKSGRIIFISSILGRKGNKDWPIYSASKWAVIGFAKSTAHLLGQDNITCNTICPGLVNTKLVNNDYVLQRWLPNSPKWETVDEWVKANSPVPMGAYVPSDIAEVVKMFCSPGMSTVTGEVFDINQGASAEAYA
ncbi:MAG TPA: SDR family NAD(P)-dependent oxidoreductase [Ignavibacteria bacterium]|nr:SDR family NAD(P)-dependent oxidoreductase [Ignavibacteria bacterium]HMR41658.1 SDR family NAD(P)-dependent oxidoreductase [Ignavibacteria bacterium]